MAERPPNILLVIADDQRFDTIHALGCSPIATPALDRLVERGTAFTQAHRAGCGDPDVGAASRAALHCGRAAGLRGEHALLGEHLGGHGYRSWAAGRWPNGCETFQRSFQGGAEIFFGTIGDPWNLPVCDYDPGGRYPGRLPMASGFAASNAVWMRQADRVTPGRHSTELLCDAAVEFLKRFDRARPFFLYLSLMAPHDPRTMPAKYRSLYDAGAMELPPNWLPGHPFDNGELDGRDEQLAAFPRTEEETRGHLAEYYAAISHLDAEVGRVLAEVEWQGLAAETVVAYASDSGLALGQHGLMGKRSLYEHSTRVPLLLSGPGVPKGERRDALCSLADVFPTLCDLAGLPTPPTVDGRSLAPLLRDAAAPGRDALYLAHSSLHRAVKEPGLKLIETVVAGGRMTQLFDLARDPWERENQAGRPGKQETVARMRERLLAMRDDDRDTPPGAAFWDGYENPAGWAGQGLSFRSSLRDLLDDPVAGEAIGRAIGPAAAGARLQGLLDLRVDVVAAWHPELFGPQTMEAIAAALDKARAAGAERAAAAPAGAGAGDASSGEPLETRSGE